MLERAQPHLLKAIDRVREFAQDYDTVIVSGGSAPASKILLGMPVTDLGVDGNTTLYKQSKRNFPEPERLENVKLLFEQHGIDTSKKLLYVDDIALSGAKRSALGIVFRALDIPMHFAIFGGTARGFHCVGTQDRNTIYYIQSRANAFSKNPHGVKCTPQQATKELQYLVEKYQDYAKGINTTYTFLS